MSDTDNQPDSQADDFEILCPEKREYNATASQAGADIETILLNRVAIIGDSQTTYKGTPAELAKELADYADRLATKRAVAELQKHIFGADAGVIKAHIDELSATLPKEAK